MHISRWACSTPFHPFKKHAWMMMFNHFCSCYLACFEHQSANHVALSLILITGNLTTPIFDIFEIVVFVWYSHVTPVNIVGSFHALPQHRPISLAILTPSLWCACFIFFLLLQHNCQVHGWCSAPLFTYYHCMLN